MQIRAAGANDRFHVSHPLDDRLRDLGLTSNDVRHALTGARMCVARDDGTFRVGGVDLDGAPLTLIVSVRNDSVVVLSEVER